METHSFQAYGFTIEVHAGGRRVWPPSFKDFVKQKLDSGEFTVEQVMADCNVSKSLVYKWRADVRRANLGRTEVREERVFSEIVVADFDDTDVATSTISHIELRAGSVELILPETFPIDDPIKIVLAVELRT
ncbi:hypothetical protein [Ruegeria sp. Ofav3-42]|uniref:hypothetical protein n=1 Tax=Ruegeria sp. Ofav3-42 TaxID=2917759 RepID=UPI001EF6C451|nr:hypothetical protein [Ruegeria sp. Ofav3-42]MCG7522760.1 hypothetical protein [Ruegeria sp. Ofav3-42]